MSKLAILAVACAASAAHADTAINFFGDVDYYVDHQSSTSNSFQAPDLDIFATQTDGKFSFVGEVLVEAFGQNTFTIDACCLEVDDRPYGWLHVRAGRIRSAFGDYGDAYQNGKFFVLAADWPEMSEGPGYDGIVPSHRSASTGDVVGELGGDRGRITADAEVLNGRGPDLDTVTALADQGNHKRVDVRLRYVGRFVFVRNAKNPSARLSSEAVKAQFGGGTTQWPSGAPVVIVIGGEGSPAMIWLADSIFKVPAKTLLIRIKRRCFAARCRARSSRATTPRRSRRSKARSA